MESRYFNTAYGIAKYLSEKQGVDGNYPARTFYGLTFSALLWSYFGEEFRENIGKALEAYRNTDKSGAEFHWEFNNYALHKLFIKSGDRRVYELLKDSRFKGTNATNWVILRAVARVYRKKPLDNLWSWFEFSKALRRQRREGFFPDDRDTRSLQYHCFSTALMAEAYEITREERYGKSFLDGAYFINDFVLPNGDTNYIGRGQEQVFGYAALIFLLEYAYTLTGDLSFRVNAEKVFRYLLGFRREDGSFPLVLRHEEKDYPKKTDVRDAGYLGWYHYNNYFDYLPILGYYLAETATLESRNRRLHRKTSNPKKDFYIHSSEKYKAAISRPGGSWANDQPFPYVCYRNESLFPCYGGEQYGETIYSKEAIPMPYGKISGKWIYFRDMDSRLNKNEILCKSKHICFRRVFDFRLDGFTMSDETLFRSNLFFEEFYPINLLFFDVKKKDTGSYLVKYGEAAAEIIASSECFIESGDFYCARGKLKALREKTGGLFSKGTVLKREIKVIFT